MNSDTTTASGLADGKSLRKPKSLFAVEMLIPSMGQAVKMLDPRTMVRNPVMFITELGAVLTTLVTLSAVISGSQGVGYFLAVSVWLWLTVWFATFAEAVAEARGRAQAATLRKSRMEVMANRLHEQTAVTKSGTVGRDFPSAERAKPIGLLVSSHQVPASELQLGDKVVVKAGETIPLDGEVIEGVASVDESAITGESAPVIRESGGDRMP